MKCIKINPITKIYPLLILIVITVFPTTSFGETFTLNSCPATTDLFDHMSEQIDDRIEGVTVSNATKAIFSTRGNLTSPWVRSSTAWTNNGSSIDWTGMSPWNSRGGYTRAGTLITPRHIALANHYSLSVGDTVLFVDDDNNTETRTVSSVRRVLTTDIQIAKLNSDLPSSFTHYPILDNETFEKYLSDGYNMNDSTLPSVMFDQQDHAIVKNTRKSELISGSFLGHSTSTEVTRATFNENLIGGDSGNPGFVLIGGKPVLLLTHLSSVAGPSYPFHKDDIQNSIDSMGGSYQLSDIDLECFNAPIVLDGSSTFSVVEDAPNGTSVGTVGIKHNVDEDTPYFTFSGGNDDGLLAINSGTGEVTIANSTLINSSSFPRTVIVMVEENGEGGKASIGSYNVRINSYPFFDSLEYNFDVDEYSNVNTVVGDTSATDAQSDALTYTILSGNVAGIFAINATTGVITVANKNLLDFETNSIHSLIVQAQESVSANTLSVDVPVNISVNDLNYDFGEENYAFEIEELDANNAIVGSVTATIVDDVEDISEIYYQIIAGNDDEIFEIDSATGAITIVDNTDLDGNNIYNLSIGVGDGMGSDVLTSVSATINITSNTRPTLSFESNSSAVTTYAVTEGSSITMEFLLSDTYSKVIIASLSQTSGSAILGSDYILSASTITFAPGETSKTVTLTALTDSLSESSETVLLQLVDSARVTYGDHSNAFITITNKAPTSSGGGGGSRSSSNNKDDSNDIDSETAVESIIAKSTETLTPPSTTLPTNPAQILALIADLRAQIQVLIAQQSGTAPTTQTAPYTRDLDLSAEGADVTQLQNFLISRGHAISAGATGYFGPQTQAALIQFQLANDIAPAVGYFGPITRAFIATLPTSN